MSDPRDRAGRSDLEGASIAKFCRRTQPQGAVGARTERAVNRTPRARGVRRTSREKKGRISRCALPLSKETRPAYQTKKVPRLKVSDSVAPLKVPAPFAE